MLLPLFCMMATLFSHVISSNGGSSLSVTDDVVIILREQQKSWNVNKLVPVCIKLSMCMKNSSPNVFPHFLSRSPIRFYLVRGMGNFITRGKITPLVFHFPMALIIVNAFSVHA